MDLDTVRNALGSLQQDAESDAAWDSLKESLSGHAGEARRQVHATLAAARQAHAERGEWSAASALLPLEVETTDDVGERVALLMELARVHQQELLDEAAALSVYAQVLEIAPGDEMAEAAVAESAERRESWRESAAEYLKEAESAPDDVYEAAMLMRSAEVQFRFAGDELAESEVLGLLTRAAKADPKNDTVHRMLERLYRRSGDYANLVTALERWSEHGAEGSERVAAAVRLARLHQHRLKDEAAAARAYERVLALVPNHTEALEALVEYASKHEHWDDLVQLYERELRQLDLSRPERVGDMLQIAMLHWKKRTSLGDAALWFERIRALEPTNGALLEFYREYCAETADEALLLTVLQGAQRVLPEGRDKQDITREIAQLAERQQDAQKAIDQYKALLRQNPESRDARQSLKGLYRRTGAYNQLVDLLRHELEALPEAAKAERLELLREVASVYREHLPSETSLVSVLNQILQVDDTDTAAVRELIALYEKIGRWRDLLANQQRLAELTRDPEERVELLRAAGRRWLEQFTNVQNATAAFESLLTVEPGDREARDTLGELYRKRRAWPALYALYESELPALDGSQRLSVMREMASLAAERLGQPEAAARLYKEILALDPGNLQVLEALEKHAERSKDWLTFSEALELRITAESEVAAKVAVLQRLGQVYEDQLKDGVKAIQAWQRVLELQPGHARAVRVLRDHLLSAEDYDALEALYTSQSDFEGLAEVLSNTADKVPGVRAKIDLSYRAARVFEERLQQPERAFRSYERILATDPMDSRAARALVPLYEKDEKWARLPALYELLVSEANDAGSKVSLYSRLYDVSAHKLSDRETAVRYARLAFEAAPEEPTGLEQLAIACREARQWQPFVEALEAQLAAPAKVEAPKSGGKKRGGKKKGQPTPTESVAAQSLDPAVVRRFELALADTYETQLARPRDAASALARVLRAAPADAPIASRLEQLLRGTNDVDQLRWLFGFRTEHAKDPSEQIQVLHAWAEFETEAPRSSELYLRILERKNDDEVAVQRVPELLLEQGEAERALEILEQYKGNVSEGLRAQLELRLAEIALNDLGRPEVALEATLRALNVPDSDVPRAVEVLQRLVEIGSTKRRAAEALADVYHGADESRREADALGVLLEVERDAAQRQQLYRRAMAVYEQLDSFGKAFESALAACREFPTELEFWDRAAKLSAASGRPTELADVYREVLRGELPPEVRRQLCERAAALHEEQLGDPVGATPYLEQLLKQDPSDGEAFAKLKQILTSAQRWHELQSLYDQTLKVLEDPASRVEALSEVAMICEEFMDDSKAATAYYEALLEEEPQHRGALEALDRLWTKHERFRDLTGLLARRIELAEGDRVRELHLRLAALHLDRLHEPEAAFEHVEHVLRNELGNVEARELAERLLQVRTLRVPASFALERVFEARDEVRDWVRVLEVRLTAWSEEPERSNSPERIELLRHIAQLKNDRLRDDDGALAVFLELVPLAPDDTEARSELLAISSRTGAFVRVADALEAAAANADSSALKGEILLQAARIYEDALGNRERAETLYHRTLVLDPADPELVLPAARSLERIQSDTGSYASLVNTLRVRLQLESDPVARAELWQRIATLCERQLGDTAAAVAAWQARLEDDPDDAVALAALDRLYESEGAWRELVVILEARSRLSNEEAERREFLRRMAVVFAERLKQPEQAINTYRGIVEEFGAETHALQALAALLRETGRWDELADVLGSLLELSPSEREALDLLSELGDLRLERLANPTGALEAYREVTERRADHGRAREALQRMLTHDDVLNRKEAAQILLPLYRAEGNAEQLAKVLITLADSEDDPIERLSVLRDAVEVTSDSLNDPEAGLALCLRALRDAVGHVDLGPWLGLLERLAARTGRRKQQVEVLSEVAPAIFDGDVQFQVLMKVAALARDELGDRELALAHFRKALEVQADSDVALEAAQRLYAEADDTANLLEVLERRAELAPSDAERKKLLAWRARLLDEKSGQVDAAIRVYESILDLDLDADAIAALEALYSREKRWDALIELWQRQLEAPGADRAGLHVRRARVLVDQLADANRAFDELEAALEVAPRSESAVTELERLMAEGNDPERRTRAAEILEPIYLARADYDRVMSTIEARLDGADAIDRRELLQRLAQLHEEQKEDYRAALETVAKLFHDDPSDAVTVQELERLAKVSDSRSRLVEIYAKELEAIDHDDHATANLCRRSGELYSELGDMERALKFYRRALAFEPESVSLFEAVDRILLGFDRHQERIDLHRSALEHRLESDDRVRLMHTIAALQNEQLGNKTAAIVCYVEILELNPDDLVALDTASRLYYDTERFEELYELVLKRAELAQDRGQAITFRLALAKLCRHELGDAERAVDQLEEIVRLDASNAAAIAELESMRDGSSQHQRVVEILTPLYELADDWRHLIRLNEDRFQFAPDLVEKVAVLRQTAELWEQRGRDARRALQALVAALQIDPEDFDVRAEFERLVDSTASWDVLAQVYSDILVAHPDLGAVRDYWLKLAQVHDGPRDDPRAALAAYEQVFRLDSSEIEPLERMEALATLLSDWQTLDWVLVAKADLLTDDEARASTWRRVGEGRRDMLDDAEGAIAAYERAHELEPDSAWTIDCLIQLYEAANDAERLVELYPRRVDVTDDDDVELSYTLLLAGAELYEKRFDNRSAAIELLIRAAERKPHDAEILKRLHRLYRAEQLWPELLDTLRAQLETATTRDARVELRREMGDILVKKLESFDEALETYALALEEVPGDEYTRVRVMELGEQHEELRERVAEVLIPALVNVGAHAAHVDVLEMRLSVESDPEVRAGTLRSIATVLLEQLSDPEGAKKALLRALLDVPEQSELHATIEELCQRTNEWSSYADALSERAQNTFDSLLARDLYARLGQVAELRLKDPGRAIEAYRHAVEQVGDEPELLLALDGLYEQAKHWTELGDVLERRSALVETDAERAELSFRLARIQLDEFGESGQGLSSLRTALELAPNHSGASEKLELLTERSDLFEEVAEILEEIYRARGATDKLAELYRKRVSLAETPGERIEMRRGLARVLEQELGDPAAAQGVLQQGLVDDPSDAELLAELERLADLSGQWTSAAAALSELTRESKTLAPELGKELCVKLAEWYQERVGDPRQAEVALQRAFEFDPTAEEVLAQLEELQSQPGRELARVETLRARARLQLDLSTREELLERAVTVADERGDRGLMEEVLREVLEQQPDASWALRALAALRADAHDHRETFDILQRLLEVTVDATEIRELRHRSAALARTQLDDRVQAVQILEQAFEDDPHDREAVDGLRALYGELDRPKPLGQLIERSTDVTDDPIERAQLRLELARLQAERFAAPQDAIDTLRVALEEDPSSAEAVVFLSRLYEEVGKDEELAELLTEQIAAAEARGDSAARLSFEVRLGEIYETKLADPGRAIEAFGRVLESDAHHVGALTALVRLHRGREDWASVTEPLERLASLAVGSERARSYRELGECWMELGDPRRAIQAYETALAAEPDAPVLRARLRELYETGEHFDRLAEFLADEARRGTDPKQQVSLLREAASVAADRLGDPSRAAQLLEEAHQLAPSDRALLLDLCDAYNAAGRTSEAITALERVVESYGGRRSKELADVHRRLAAAFQASGEIERAAAELDKAFRIEPGNVAVLKALGDLSLELNDLKRAQQMFRALLLQRLEGDSPITKAEVFHRLGVVHHRLDEKDKALQMLERALQTDPSLAEARELVERLQGG